MADLTRIDAAQAVEITDGSSQTVGVTTSLPATNAVGLNVREVRQGQATMANSVPVAVASDQSALQIVGNIAHDSGDSGNPVKIGGVARTANPTAVTALDRVDACFDKIGRQVVVVGHVRDLVTTNTITLSSTAETTLLSAGGSGVFHDVTMIVASNSSNTSVRVNFRDATGGTILFSIYLAPDGGGVVIPFNPPFPQATANNNWTAQLSGSVSDVRIMAMAIKNV